MSRRHGFHENHNLNVFWWVGGVGGFEFFWKPNGIQGARKIVGEIEQSRAWDDGELIQEKNIISAWRRLKQWRVEKMGNRFSTLFVFLTLHGVPRNVLARLQLYF